MSAKSRRNRPTSSNPFFLMERIWAEHGLVKILLKTGKKIHLRPQVAARRAMILNQGNIPDETKRHVFTIVEKVIEVCREALAQQATPKDKATKLMTDTLQGKLSTGAPVISVNSNVPELQRLMAKYPLLSPREIQVVLDSPKYNRDYKEQMLTAIQSDRQAELAKSLVVKAPASA